MLISETSSTADDMQNLLDSLDAYSKLPESLSWLKKAPTNLIRDCVSERNGKSCMKFSNSACKTKQIDALVKLAHEHFGVIPPCSVKEDSQAYAKKMTFKWIFDDGGNVCVKEKKIPSGTHEIDLIPYCMDYASSACKKTVAIKLLKKVFKKTAGDKLFAIFNPCDGAKNQELARDYTSEAYYAK